MSERSLTQEKKAEILVALDASPHSLAALRAAVELASLLEADLSSIFVEDVNLIRLCELPFTREIGSYSATVRQIDSESIEREFRMLAAHIRKVVAQTADPASVNWSFQVARGSVTSELLAASESAILLTLGRVGRTPGKRFGSTARTLAIQSKRPIFLLGDAGLVYPLSVVYSGSAAADRALRLALVLTQVQEKPLQIYTMPDLEQSGSVDELLQRCLESATTDYEEKVIVIAMEGTDLLATELESAPAGTLILPMEFAALLEHYAHSAILVPPDD